MSALTSLKVGDPVLVGKARERGTVRFIGETHFQAGEWVGVELEKLGLGKNNGSVETTTTDAEGKEVTEKVEYFSCAGNQGLFVRPDRCTLATMDTPSNSTDHSGVAHERSARSTGTPQQDLRPEDVPDIKTLLPYAERVFIGLRGLVDRQRLSASVVDDLVREQEVARLYEAEITRHVRERVATEHFRQEVEARIEVEKRRLVVEVRAQAQASLERVRRTSDDSSSSLPPVAPPSPATARRNHRGHREEDEERWRGTAAAEKEASAAHRRSAGGGASSSTPHRAGSGSPPHHVGRHNQHSKGHGGGGSFGSMVAISTSSREEISGPKEGSRHREQQQQQEEEQASPVRAANSRGEREREREAPAPAEGRRRVHKSSKQAPPTAADSERLVASWRSELDRALLQSRALHEELEEAQESNAWQAEEMKHVQQREQLHRSQHKEIGMLVQDLIVQWGGDTSPALSPFTSPTRLPHRRPAFQPWNSRNSATPLARASESPLGGGSSVGGGVEELDMGEAEGEGGEGGGGEATCDRRSPAAPNGWILE